MLEPLARLGLSLGLGLGIEQKTNHHHDGEHHHCKYIVYIDGDDEKYSKSKGFCSGVFIQGF